MYALLVMAVLGADLQAEKDWYLSRKLHDTQVIKGKTLGDYYIAKNSLEALSVQDQKAIIGAERIRSEQTKRAYKIFMEGQQYRLEQTRKKAEQRRYQYPRYHYPQYYYSPYRTYHANPYYADPYRRYYIRW